MELKLAAVSRVKIEPWAKLRALADVTRRAIPLMLRRQSKSADDDARRYLVQPSHGAMDWPIAGPLPSARWTISCCGEPRECRTWPLRGESSSLADYIYVGMGAGLPTWLSSHRAPRWWRSSCKEPCADYNTAVYPLILLVAMATVDRSTALACRPRQRT
jgi:hypothetical protein